MYDRVMSCHRRAYEIVRSAAGTRLAPEPLWYDLAQRLGIPFEAWDPILRTARLAYAAGMSPGLAFPLCLQLEQQGLLAEGARTIGPPDVKEGPPCPTHLR